MLDMLGDRDYDNFDHWEFKHLETKIGFALYGPPQVQDGYDEKQKKKIVFLFNIIHKESSKYTRCSLENFLVSTYFIYPYSQFFVFR